MKEFFIDQYDMQGLYTVPASMSAPRPYSGFEYLYYFYFLPWEVVGGTHLRDMPRNPLKVIFDDKWRRIYTSDYFKEVIERGWGLLLWPHLGIPGRMDDYAAGSFFYSMATSYLNWFRVIGLLGYHPKALASVGTEMEFVFPTMGEVVDLVIKMVGMFKKNSRFEEWRDVYLQHPDFEDFEPKRKSRVKIDHYRKYYHTRAKASSTISPDAMVLDMQRNISNEEMPEDRLAGRIIFDQFKDTLSKKDRTIVELLEQDCTQKDIANILGYANHSGVSKKLKTIARKYLDFVDEQQGRRSFLSGGNT